MFCPQTLFLFALIRFVAVVKRSRNHAKFIRKMACNNTKIGSRRKYKVGGEVERRTALCDSVAAKTDMGHYSGWLYVGSEAEVMIYWCVVWGTLFWLPPVRLQNVWTVKYEWGIYNSRDCCPLNVRKSSFEKDIVQSYWMSRFQMAKSIAAIATMTFLLTIGEPIVLSSNYRNGLISCRPFGATHPVCYLFAWSCCMHAFIYR